MVVEQLDRAARAGVPFVFSRNVPAIDPMQRPQLSVFMPFCLCFFLTASSWAQSPIRMAADPSLSPDGKSLLLSWQGDIWQVSSDGGAATRLTSDPADDGEPHYSPDGKRIAFISNRTGSRQIYVMPADGGQAEQVTAHSEGYSLLGWFPDGRSLLARGVRDAHWRAGSAGRLLRVYLDPPRADQVLLDAYADDAHLSPDGNRLLLVREGERWWRKGYTGERASQIWLYDLRSGELEELLHEGVDCRWPRWMRNGRGFYFTKGDHAGFNLYRYRFANQPGAEPSIEKVVDMEDDSIVFPTIAANGQTVVFRHLFDLYRWRPRQDAAPVKLEIVDPGDTLAASDLLRRVLQSASEVDFMDDGLELTLAAGGDIWVMDTKLREPQRVTDSHGWAEQPVFSPDGQQLWFAASRDGQVDLYRAERADAELAWWENTKFTVQQMTDDAPPESNLRFSHDGKRLFFTRGLGELWYRQLEDGSEHQLLDGFRAPDYDLSSDGFWITYAAQDDDFNSDIWIAAIDGSIPPVNISRHPRNEYTPRFSPDGQLLAFVGQRIGEEYDLYYVYLQLEKDQQTSRQRTLDEARQLMAKRSSSGGGKGKPNESPEGASPGDEAPHGSIDLKNIHERVRRIAVPESRPSNLFWDPKGEKLLFSANIEGRSGLYSVTFPGELNPKFLTGTTGSQHRWPKAAGAILMLSGGVPTKLEPSGNKSERYTFRAYQEFSRQQWFSEGFDTAWRIMRDRWYDPRLGNRNWDAVRRKLRPMAAQAPDIQTLGDVIQLMLGELNGSHMGFTPDSDWVSRYRPEWAWTDSTAHLGVRFDSEWKGPGWKIRDVILDSPADRLDSRLLPGEIILEIDGRKVDPELDPTLVLNGRLDRDIVLLVAPADFQPAEDTPPLEEPVEEGDAAALSDESSSDDDAVASEPAEPVAETPGDDTPAGADQPAGEAAERDQATSEEQPAAESEPAAAAGPRQVSLRPISYGRVRTLLYDQWLEHNRQMVDRLSGGRLGYLHIQGMNMPSFHEFQRQLFNVGYQRDGLVIDVRDNGGGSTTDLLLTALTQPRHAITVPRGGNPGYPHDRTVFAAWHKPIVVLCNQNSYSNAEIFSHAIKGIGRGKLVGVTTAGGVISTGSVSVMDVGQMRMPFRAWFVAQTGEDMEMHGAVPDVLLWPDPREHDRGDDSQLETAVQLLTEEVEELTQQPQPRLRYATER